MLVGIRPLLFGTKHYRVCDVTDHRCGTRGTGRLFVRGLETWDLWGKKHSCAVAGKKKGSIVVCLCRVGRRKLPAGKKQ